MEILKRCSSCKTNKLLDDFHKRKGSKDGHDHCCKLCSNTRHRKKYANDSEHRKLMKSKNSKLKFDNKCAICGKSEIELNRTLCIDHNHITNKLRGLLCTKCNLGLGSFSDNIEVLQNAIEYLKQYN